MPKMKNPRYRVLFRYNTDAQAPNVHQLGELDAEQMYVIRDIEWMDASASRSTRRITDMRSDASLRTGTRTTRTS